MLNLLKQTYDKAEGLKGKKLLYTLVIIFVSFLALGFSINYFITTILKNNETREQVTEGSNNVANIPLESMEGIITYTDPKFYAEDDISYYLSDKTGKYIILLKAQDQKLQVAEGLYVTVYGNKAKTKNGGKEVMFVEKVVINTK